MSLEYACIISCDETLKLKYFSCDRDLDHRSMSSRRHRTLLLSVSFGVMCVLKLPKGYFMSKQSKTAWNTFGEIPWPKCQFVTCNSGSRSLFGYLLNRSLLMSFCCCFVCFLFTKVVYHMPESFWWYSGTKIRLVSWHSHID